MGCDIHFYVERKTDNGWVRVPDSKGPRHPYYKESSSAKHKAHFDRREWDLGRNYFVFGRLAGVRWDQVVPIALPKGVPEDMSDEVKKLWEEGQGDWHTPSFFSAQELLAVKDDPIIFRVYMSLEEYKTFKASGRKEPGTDEIYWTEVPGNSVVVSNAEMDKILGLMAFWDGASYFTSVEWQNTALEMDRHLFDVILPAMLAIEPDPEKIRIVFWFDN